MAWTPFHRYPLLFIYKSYRSLLNCIWIAFLYILKLLAYFPLIIGRPVGYSMTQSIGLSVRSPKTPKTAHYDSNRDTSAVFRNHRSLYQTSVDSN